MLDVKRDRKAIFNKEEFDNSIPCHVPGMSITPESVFHVPRLYANGIVDIGVYDVDYILSRENFPGKLRQLAEYRPDLSLSWCQQQDVGRCPVTNAPRTPRINFDGSPKWLQKFDVT